MFSLGLRHAVPSQDIERRELRRPKASLSISNFPTTIEKYQLLPHSTHQNSMSNLAISRFPYWNLKGRRKEAGVLPIDDVDDFKGRLIYEYVLVAEVAVHEAVVAFDTSWPLFSRASRGQESCWRNDG